MATFAFLQDNITTYLFFIISPSISRIFWLKIATVQDENTTKESSTPSHHRIFNKNLPALVDQDSKQTTPRKTILKAEQKQIICTFRSSLTIPIDHSQYWSFEIYFPSRESQSNSLSNMSTKINPGHQHISHSINCLIHPSGHLPLAWCCHSFPSRNYNLDQYITKNNFINVVAYL